MKQEELLGAIARGWCSNENSGKEMDVTLALAIAREVEDALHASETPLEPSFYGELRALINRHSKENGSNTPDYLLAAFLDDCLRTFETTVRRRDAWYKTNDPFAASSLPCAPAS